MRRSESAPLSEAGPASAPGYAGRAGNSREKGMRSGKILARRVGILGKGVRAER